MLKIFEIQTNKTEVTLFKVVFPQSVVGYIYLICDNGSIITSQE